MNAFDYNIGRFQARLKVHVRGNTRSSHAHMKSKIHSLNQGSSTPRASLIHTPRTSTRPSVIFKRTTETRAKIGARPAHAFRPLAAPTQHKKSCGVRANCKIKKSNLHREKNWWAKRGKNRIASFSHHPRTSAMPEIGCFSLLFQHCLKIYLPSLTQAPTNIRNCDTLYMSVELTCQGVQRRMPIFQIPIRNIGRQIIVMHTK